MSKWREQAVAKLEKEKQGSFDRHGEVMKGQLCEYLARLCDNEEFAQAVVQGGSFADCMKAVAKGVGGGISDLDAVRRAAQFYFPGAEVHFDIRLELAGDAGDVSTPSDQPKLIRLADFW